MWVCSYGHFGCELADRVAVKGVLSEMPGRIHREYPTVLREFFIFVYENGINFNHATCCIAFLFELVVIDRWMRSLHEQIAPKLNHTPITKFVKMSNKSSFKLQVKNQSLCKIEPRPIVSQKWLVMTKFSVSYSANIHMNLICHSHCTPMAIVRVSYLSNLAILY